MTVDRCAILVLIESALSDENGLKSGIRSLQNYIWDNVPVSEDDQLTSALYDLAYDLEYFEPDAVIRFEEPSYYGEQKAREMLAQALMVLRQAS